MQKRIGKPGKSLRLDPVFSSNMVLQQKRPIAFFGTSEPGSKIQVAFNGRTAVSKADADGVWKTVFPAMKAGNTPYKVTVADGKTRLELTDILIGEVWFCSGQSNMQLPVGKVFRMDHTAYDSKKETAAADYPEIRLAFQLRTASHHVQLPAQYSTPLSSGWVKCSPASIPYFSACAYFFGRKLYQDLKVPIGLIHASFGGTRIETWISEAGYEQFGPAEEWREIQQFRLDEAGKKACEEKEAKRFIEAMAAWHPRFEAAGAQARARAEKWSSADFDDSKWETATAQPIPKYLVRWYRISFTLSSALKGKNLVFSMGKAGEEADIWLNGKKIAGWNADDPESRQKAVIALTPDQLDQTGKNVIAVRGEYFYVSETRSLMNEVILNSTLAAGKAVRHLRKGWKMNEEFSCTPSETGDLAAPKFISVPWRYSRLKKFQSNLYNGMAAAWTKLPVRGVIWYQGCSNAGKPRYYRLHRTLISDWRARWNRPDMPFIIMQLAGYEPEHAKDWRTADPNLPSGYALIRDIQLQMLQIPNVGLATAIDIGKATVLHPPDKQNAGLRLALEAERMVYGKKIVSRGPLFRSAVPEGNALRVSFQYADSGLKTSDGRKPGAFAIAGADRRFVWADARIDGKTVVVSSPEIKKPRYVRYAYMGYRGDCNLQNAEGLPAYPFRSDAVDYSKAE